MRFLSCIPLKGAVGLHGCLWHLEGQKSEPSGPLVLRKRMMTEWEGGIHEKGCGSVRGFVSGKHRETSWEAKSMGKRRGLVGVGSPCHSLQNAGDRGPSSSSL